MGWFGGLTTITPDMAPGGYEAVEVGAAAVGLNPGKYKGQVALPVRAALLSAEDADIRFRLDGGDPTAAEGHALVAGDILVLTGGQTLNQFKAIRAGANSAKLRVTYFY